MSRRPACPNATISDRITSEPPLMKHPESSTLPRRLALSSAVASICLGMGIAAAQAGTDAPPAWCVGEARGRMADRCTAEERAREIDGGRPLPANAERELPRMTFVLGDERALRERRETHETVRPGEARDHVAHGVPRFDSGEDVLLPADRARLDEIAAQVGGHDDLRFEIIGHTDVQRLSRERRKIFADNHALGMARAEQVGRYLTTRLGLPPTAYTAASKGPDEPIATPREDRANWAANRRVEVRVYWRETPAPVVTRETRVTHDDPSECAMLSPYAEGDGPVRVTIDGDPKVGLDSSSADRQRCTDVRLERNDLRLQYDNLSMPRRLAGAAWPTTVVAGDTVRFAAYGNYRLFVARAELRLFTANDAGQATELATLPLDADWRAQWQVPPGLLGRFADATGGKVYYRVRVYDKAGRFDETDDYTLTVADRHVPEATAPDAARELMRAYGENRLTVANIPLAAGTITASGRAIAPGQRVRALGFEVPVDDDGRFVFQQLVPRRVQTAEIAVIEPDGAQRVYRRDLRLPGRDWFFVGQADLTVGRNRVSGPAELAHQGERQRYSGDTWTDGRLAFYTKGLLNERWALTGSVDTEERPVQDLFRNFDRKDATSLFRRIDPTDTWATFGDDSTSIEDAPTQGRIYLRVDDGRSHAMWGNYKLNFGDTALTQVSRGLYGFEGRYLGEDSTSSGEPGIKVQAYAAEPGTLAAREEFRGTGGSLYYLRHQDITSGAEKLFVEVRDKDSGFVRMRRQLVPASDYDIDYLQGRVVLTSPLPSLSDDGTLVRAGALVGMPVFLVADYEYTPLVGSLDTLAAGGRVAWWVSDLVRVGVTGARQTQTGGDQNLAGADILLRRSEATYLKAEVARSKGPGTGQLGSLDGGYSFQAANDVIGDTTRANAWRVEGQVDLKDVAVAPGGRLGAYAQRREAGFSAPGQITSNPLDQFGASVALPLGEKTDLRLKADRRDEVNGYNTSAGEAQVGWQATERWKFSTAVRADDKTTDALNTSTSYPSALAVEGSRTDVAVQADYGADGWGAYGFAQATAQRTGTRRDNDRIGAGGRYGVSDKLGLNGEMSTGDGGVGGKAGVDYRYDDRSSVYMTYVLDTGRTDENVTGRGGTWVSGVKSRAADGLDVYTEHRQTTGAQAGLTHAYGVQYAPDKRWTLGAGFENGTLNAETTGAIERQAVTLSAGYSTSQTRYSGGAEYRRDASITERRTSWLLKNAWTHRLDADARWLGKLNWADSDGSGGGWAAARYTEAMLGYGYRPVFDDRLNLLFKYTYLFDLSSPGQVLAGDARGNSLTTTGIDYQQRSHVVAVDATYDLTPRWTLGGKYAWRLGELRASRDSSAPWFRSSAELAIVRVDWDVVRRWDWMVELRSLRAKELEDRKTGWLTALYYHASENAKVGVGYNFTDYSDDLTDMSYRARGWFVNILGKF
ncbi:MAG: OmpA family protein [Candidatus Dactylopiibacterium sp.]|nr:OmpA family protein [Candidatus Dactylopiibacterium sp.]